jgi:hypothetical protein
MIKSNQRKVSDIGIPKTSQGEKDKRYKEPQILKNDGTRDKRCNLMSSKKK